MERRRAALDVHVAEADVLADGAEVLDDAAEIAENLHEVLLINHDHAGSGVEKDPSGGWLENHVANVG